MSTVYRLRSDTAAWTRTGEDVVVLDLRSSTYLATNPAAQLLWPLLVDGADAGTLAAALVAEFEVDRARADEDVTAFLAGLLDRGLVAAAEE